MAKNLLVILIFALLSACSQDTATIMEDLKTFQTYSYSDPNPLPQPDRKYYPYFRFDGYNKKSEPFDWKVIEMENSYVKVHILPEIGGKIWGAIEKSTGNEFIYYNSVVKFRNIAMRGPWTSGGIELNFGVIGHSPSVSTPVDYVIRENEDGSVSCFIGALDLLTRTWWETEVNLHSDNAYFTTTTRWRNTTSILQPYYNWSNAAYKAEGDLELIFPGTYWVGHGGEANPWPVDETGRDLSFYRNNDFGPNKSYHIIGGPYDFFAAYWHDLDFGAGLYSLFGDKIGKKIWLWSQARSGAIWEDLLTDKDGQYVELQSGRLFNQASSSSTRTPFKHIGFSPHNSDVFTEYWFPIMDIGGAVKANYLGALNVIKGQNDQKVYFSPLQPLRDEIHIYFGNELKYSFDINLNPLEVWEKDISLNPTSEPLEIIVGAKKELIYSEETASTVSSRPVAAPGDFDWNSVYGLYTDGVNWVYQSRFDRAHESFMACLNKDSLYAPALNHIAELYLRRSDLESAMDNVKKSLAINAYDPKANLLFGLISRKLDKLLDAQDGFAVASITPAYRVAAYIELAKLFIKKDQLVTAQKYAERVLESDINNQDGLLLMAIILRKNGREKEAGDYLDQLESVSPLNHFSRFEKILLKEDNHSASNFTSMIRNELPHETYIEMALWYKYLECNREAIRLLEMAPATPMVNLKLAYLYNLNDDGEKTDLYFNRSIQDAPDFVFPFRVEFVPILEWAVSITNDWKPKYLLGLLHWSLGNREQAKDLFSRCGEDPKSFYFYIARRNLFIGDPIYDPEQDLNRAYELDKSEWRTHLALIEYYLGKNYSDEALKIAKKSIEMFPENEALKYTYAKCLLANGFYSKSLIELENTVILPYENASYGRVTYRQAAVMEGLKYIGENSFDQALKSINKARLWPENLGVGRPYDVDERIEDFLQANILIQLGEKDKADVLYQDIINYTEDRRDRYNSTDFLYLVVLRRMGMIRHAENFMEQWQRTSPDDPVLRWSRAMLNDNRALARQIEQKIVTEAGGTPWDPSHADAEFELVKAISYHIN